VYQKATAQSPDSGAIVYQVGSGITIVSSLLGQLNLIIPRANVPTPGTQWWRLDLVDGSGGVATALYGPMTVKAV
jgi:heme/copper-type cytochrome/quinol oxidase subunit 1